MPNSFDVATLDYDLPEHLIAQEPVSTRGTSRMLVLDRSDGSLADKHIADLPDYLGPKDALVLNNTRVLPGKFTLQRATGGRIEGLFLTEDESGTWEVLLKGAARLSPGEVLTFDPDTGDCSVTVVERIEAGRWRLEVPAPAAQILDRVGRMPLPPYIKRSKRTDHRDSADRQWYQTVFAAQQGAVAAPTAGLHFTPDLLDKLNSAGVTIEQVTLHVGYGTFAPIEVSDLADHQMHSEYYEISESTCRTLAGVRPNGGRIVAVGTTSARVLESSWHNPDSPTPGSGWTNIFCYPPYQFRGVDAMLTNFHLPKSTLIAMIMALAGVDLIRKAYDHAIAQSYRFYSYGDAMLIL